MPKGLQHEHRGRHRTSSKEMPALERISRMRPKKGLALKVTSTFQTSSWALSWASRAMTSGSNQSLVGNCGTTGSLSDSIMVSYELNGHHDGRSGVRNRHASKSKTASLVALIFLSMTGFGVHTCSNILIGAAPIFILPDDEEEGLDIVDHMLSIFTAAALLRGPGRTPVTLRQAEHPYSLMPNQPLCAAQTQHLERQTKPVSVRGFTIEGQGSGDGKAGKGSLSLGRSTDHADASALADPVVKLPSGSTECGGVVGPAALDTALRGGDTRWL